MIAKLSTTLLLTRHIMRTMSSHVLRTAIVWLALAASLAVIIGVFSFSRSINDSHRARGESVRGVADLQIQAVGNSTFSPDLAREIEAVRGTRYAVAIDELRIAIHSKHRVSQVATAFGIDNRARKLRSALQRELDVDTPKDPEKGGLTISRQMAAQLDVKRGDKVRVLAFTRSRPIKIRHIEEVAPALSEVVALPRKSVELMRGSDGPNTLFVQLDKGTTQATWRKRANDILPDNATLVTPEGQQHQLDQVLNVTTRSYTYLFGAVALLIVTLLVYVLQLMRMMDRQEDAGLVRALGSNSMPLALAEILTLATMLALALPAGIWGGRAFAHQLAGNLPDYLTQVFNFTMIVEVQPAVVAIAIGATLGVAAIATIGALVTTRAPVADQLGRSPQSGATTVASISLPAAVALTITGIAGLVLAASLSSAQQYVATSICTLLGIGLVAPGMTALLIHGLMRISASGGPARLVARSAVESNPRRVAISAAIMALAVSAVVPLQLLDHALDERVDEMTGIHNQSVQRIAASDDLFTTVPVRLEYLRKGLEEKRKPVKVKPPQPQPGQTAADVKRATRKAVAAARAAELRRPLPDYAAPFVMGFSSYRGQRIGLMALDSRRTWPFLHKADDAERRSSASALRANRSQAVISTQLSAWTGLNAGDKVRLQTTKGMRSTKISAVVDDMSWPMGTVYLDITRHRKLFGRDAVNSLIVNVHRIEGQMDKTRQNMLAMRWMIILAALVALAGILATSVLARRREWGVLRAVGMGRPRLLAALALEISVILLIGAAIGVIGGVITFEGPIHAFLSDQGFSIGREIVAAPLAITGAIAIAVGLVAVMLSALVVVRAKLIDALSYE
ncbi:MAG: ABC transporter permease [Actinobacteria bacterium]|nr:ABC transporter permease [Actinomycetota bacterium]